MSKVGLKGNQHICRCKTCHNLFYAKDKKTYVYKKWIKGKLEYFCSYKCFTEFEKGEGNEKKNYKDNFLVIKKS